MESTIADKRRNTVNKMDEIKFALENVPITSPVATK
jgi:hypothetical protein